MKFITIPLLAIATLSFTKPSKNNALVQFEVQGNRSVTGGGTGLEPVRIDGEDESEMVKSIISVNAIQKDDGSVSGKINYDWRGGDFKIKAEVKCLSFNGNIAKVTAVITEVDGSEESIAKYGRWGYAIGRECVISIQDNGKDDDKFSDIYARGCNGKTNAPYVKVSGNFTIK